jgi:hypothetical protein
MKVYYRITNKQKRLEDAKGHNKLEPQFMTQDQRGNVYWKKWNDCKPLKINYFRVWSTDASGESILINVYEMYNQCKGLEQDILTYAQTITRRYFRFPPMVDPPSCIVQ